MPADAIRKITVRGFKSIASLELEPGPINVIIGSLQNELSSSS